MLRNGCWRSVRLGGVSAILGLGVRASAQASLVGLGDLPGGDSFSLAAGVSADGRVVCGSSEGSAGPEAFLWTSGAGMVGLGDLEGGDYASYGRAISDDGTVIVGASSSSNAIVPNTEGFRWTSTGGMQGIGVVGSGRFAQSPATGVSADGSLLVGLTTGWGVTRGFTWTSGAGFTDCGLLQGDTLGLVWDADEHGSLVVGAAARIDGQYGRKYTGAGGWESLFSGINGAGISVTADASVITGRYGAGNSMEPLYFTSVGGATGVGNAPGTDHGAGWDLSGDGSVIVGTAELVGSSDQVAIIWIDGLGTHQLQSWLEDNFGLDLGGWTLTRASGVSDDGLVIVGEGLNRNADREGWRAEIPWLSCPADWNKDGVLDTDDVSAFSTDWGAGDADVNGDSRTNTLDWFAFLNVYSGGC